MADDLFPILQINYTEPITRQAWEILQRAEQELTVLYLARERAAYHGYVAPETPGEYLWWILDEAQIQEDSGHDEQAWAENTRSGEPHLDMEYAQLAYGYSTALRRYAIELLLLGIRPQEPTKREVS